jgi:ribosomal-protein-alanine N-acetyltransferase
MLKTLQPDFMLETERCILRRARISDAASIVRAVTDARYPADDTWSDVITEADATSRLAGQLDRWESGEDFHFSIELSKTSELLGQISLAREPEPDTWLLGYWIAPAKWGLGLATEVAGAAIRLAASSLGARSIWAGTTPTNIRSRRVLEKLRFEFRNENPCGYQLHGVDVATLEFELTDLAGAV